MKTEKKISILFWVFIVILVFGFVDTIAWAGGDRIDVRQSNDMNNQTAGDVIVNSASAVKNSVTVPVTQGPITQGSVTGGDVNVGGDKNRAYMLSNSMGDVDIGACYGSKHWSTPIVGNQGYTMLLVQCAERLDAMGLHLAAALMRCADETYADLFASRTECLQLSTIPDDVAVPEPALGDDEDEEIEALKAELASLRAEVAQSKEKTRKATLEARYAVQQAQERPEQQYGLSDEQVAELEAWEQRWTK